MSSQFVFVAFYSTGAYLAFWFYGVFSTVIVYVLAHCPSARTRYKWNVEKPMPPPPSG